MNPLSEDDIRMLQEAIAPYVDLQLLRRIAAVDATHVYDALLTDDPPPEVRALLDLLVAVLRPYQITSIGAPVDVAALMMVEMSHLPQEQLRVICLDSKNHIQVIHMLYQGSVYGLVGRMGEIFREPLRRNSARIILVHNHPSGDPTPSPEDLILTQQAIDVGKMLDVDVLDHLIIGHGNWVSVREHYLQFD